uniref:Thiol peroxidase n=1 Tax=Uncultured bacterium HF130_AEPn_1 TaxID=663362 RepID=D0E8K2_UNCHF|nr:peroxiredoxin [uncultured bacterium HF130_AEPn_1]
MAKITLGGNDTSTNGELPEIGTKAPDFLLTDSDLKDHRLSDFSGTKLILNIVPSLGTGVCQSSAKKFNELASGLESTKVLVISADLPFAQGAFCGQEGLENIMTLSQMRNRDFGKDYGIEIQDGKFQGLAARSVVVLDENHKVVYTQLVPEIGQEPDYDKAVAAI